MAWPVTLGSIVVTIPDKPAGIYSVEHENGEESRATWYLKRMIHLSQELGWQPRCGGKSCSGLCWHRKRFILGKSWCRVRIFEQFLRACLDSVGSICMMCGKAITLETPLRVWPCLCGGSACDKEYDVAVDNRIPGDLDLIRTEFPVCELLTSLTEAAIHSPYVETLTRFPQIFCGVHTNQEPLKGMREAFASLPRGEKLQMLSREGDLDSSLAAINPNLPGLLAWVLSRYKGKIVSVQNKDLSEKLGPCKVFLMFNGTPCDLSARKTVFAFHGSSWYKWCAIMSNGLRNMTKTHLEAHGPHEHSGIYTAPGLSLAYQFSCLKRSDVDDHDEGFLDFQRRCIALCEIDDYTVSYDPAQSACIDPNDILEKERIKECACHGSVAIRALLVLDSAEHFFGPPSLLAEDVVEILGKAGQWHRDGFGSS